MNKTIILLALVTLLLVPAALSLGVTPGKVTLDFEPNLETAITINVINNDQKDFTVLALVEGDLKDYITLENARLDFTKADGSKPLSYKVKLPGALSKPGTHQTFLKIRETKSAEDTDAPISVGASIEVVSLLIVNAPYKGKYVQSQMFISEGEVGEETVFAITAENVGEEDIGSISAKIDVYDSAGTKVTTLATDEKSLNVRNKRELVARWTPDKAGKFKAKAVLSYDGGTASLEKEFIIGGFFLKLHDITVKNFKLGGVAKFQILVENIGGDLIKEAYGEMELKDETGKQVMDIDSNRKNLQPEEQKDLEAFWETEKVEKGFYDGSITLRYEDKQKTQPIRTTVRSDGIDTQLLTTGMAIAPPASKPKTNSLVIILIITLIAINIGWFVYFKRKKA